jgi:hypothetical protein
MKPKKSEIIAPEGGWVDQSYYEVEVSVCETNPIFNAILYTGFVDKERPDLPGGYSFIVSPGMEDHIDLCQKSVRFLRACRFLFTRGKTVNTYKLPADENVTKSRITSVN